jgi:L-methionine (R)-S-oxide reductase
MSFHFEVKSGGKREAYESLNAALGGLVDAESDWLANLANAAALIFHSLPDLNWAGFYLFKQGELVLGPFQGKLACTRIKLGRGVCGTAARDGVTQVVADVDAFPGHIACDSASRSEIVIPIRVNGELFGVLDVDSPVMGRFDDQDRAGLELFVARLSERLSRKG